MEMENEKRNEKQKNLKCRIKCARNIFNNLTTLSLSGCYETHQLMQMHEEMKFRLACLEILMKFV